LRSGKNDLQIELPGLNEVPAEITLLDWFEVRYPRKLKAVDDRLDLEGIGAPLRLLGFTGAVQVYDLSQPVPAITLTADQQGDIIWRGEKDHRYSIVGPKGALKPVSINPALMLPDLTDKTLSADFLIIGPEDLLAAAQPLLDWREKNSLHGLMVPIQAVYDQFNAGLPEPEAIRTFIRATQGWVSPPSSILLLGDATYDPRGYTGANQGNRLPAFFVATEHGGETASDIPFVDVDGDQRPELAIGRIPARQPEQVTAVVNKTIAYEQSSTPGGWCRNILAVADGQEAYFKGDAEAFLERVPAGYVKNLFAWPAGSTDAARTISQYLEQGQLMVAYFGHGSVQMWGKDRIFTTRDAPGLTNGAHLPVVLQSTCLSGLFTHPQIESLSEALLFNPKGGAVATLAPTSLTLSQDQASLITPLIQALFSGKGLTFGEALLQARRSLSVESTGSLDVLRTFLLLGDPLLRLQTCLP
jgi:hypothetical protein